MRKLNILTLGLSAVAGLVMSGSVALPPALAERSSKKIGLLLVLLAALIKHHCSVASKFIVKFAQAVMVLISSRSVTLQI